MTGLYLRKTLKFLRRPIAIIVLGVVALVCASPYLLDALWGNVPIVFYGRVVDESGKGVPGAVVTMNVLAQMRLQIPAPFAPSQTGWLVTATTGPGGCFVIHGGRGTDLVIVSVEKSGFDKGVYGPGRSDFSYSPNPGVPRFRPNRSAPEIFHVRHLR